MLFDTVKQLSYSDRLTLAVDGHCMAGVVAHGSRVQIQRPALYWPGDLVVFGRGDDRLVMHRFLGYVPGRHGWRGITRADSRNQADAPVAVYRILGKVMRIDDVIAVCDARQRLRAGLRYLQALAHLAIWRLPGLVSSSSG